MPEACRVNAPKSANLGLTEPLQRGFLLQLCRKDAIWQKRQSFREAEKSSGPHTWSATQAALISRAVTKRTLSKGVVCPAGQLLCARQAISPRGAERFESERQQQTLPSEGYKTAFGVFTVQWHCTQPREHRNRTSMSFALVPNALSYSLSLLGNPSHLLTLRHPFTVSDLFGNLRA